MSALPDVPPPVARAMAPPVVPLVAHPVAQPVAQPFRAAAHFSAAPHFSAAAHSRAAVALAIAFLVTGCRQDPNTKHARLLERAASWSAAVQFAGEMAQKGYVTDGYMRDVVSTAAKEIDTLKRRFDEEHEIDQRQRDDAARACERMASMLRAADLSGAAPDASELRAIELRLREAATQARGMPQEARR